MYNSKWYSFKHNAWASVTNEPKTKNGYYTVEFPALGIFRRYNATRIREEMLDQANLDAQLGAQLGLSSAVGNSSVRMSQSLEYNNDMPLIVGHIAKAPTKQPEYANNVIAFRPNKRTASVKRSKPGTLINLVFAWKD